MTIMQLIRRKIASLTINYMPKLIMEISDEKKRY